MSVNDRDVWHCYESDALEALREIEESLLELESEPENAANIHRLYRGLHSIKGNSGFLQLASIERLAHVSEDLIGLARDAGSPLDQELVELMLQAVDRLRSMIEAAGRERRNVSGGPPVELLVDNILEAYLMRGGKPKHNPGPAFQIFESLPAQANVEAPTGAEDPETLALFLALASKLVASIEAELVALKQPGARAAEARAQLLACCDQLVDSAERVALAQVASAAARFREAIVSAPPSAATNFGELELYRALSECERRYQASATAAEDFGLAATLRRTQAAAEQPLAAAAGAPAASDQATPAASRKQPAEDRPDFLRVDAQKVSLIMDLASEIGLACGAVTHHPELAQLELEGFSSAAHKLELLVRELQNEVSGMRLVPIAGVFQRMKRVVRDAARRTNKEVELVLEGEETEIDKVMVDSLHDPLVHVLRNSIDHGIEPTAERVQSGKPPAGRIVLAASYQGGEVSVVVRDDGRGLDRERIWARAKERGLVSEPASAYTDQQIYELICLPGFSTKVEVDELSGRGVGMDVVKTTIESLRGRLNLHSQAGKGFKLDMTMPLTLAFVEAMVVRERDRLFAIPIERVSEVFKPEQKQVSRNSADGRTMIRIREMLFPVLWLHRFWQEPGEHDETLEDRVIVVVQTSRGGLALPVDLLLGNQQVMLKPSQGALSRIRAGAGCGVLRSGDVALTLDCERLHA